ncbi:hypothetical protein PCANC_28152 [Puccinia coronata f. sp. avenae]|uniref:Uncharacterized protein n=1 Tax=Puccinia coronata f. sp. avenae TaxID=200324 RepID=A0A2N5TDS1_9BASI|nr:hypothetical protein PCANC_28152 [Puccinia coronata f. sp. avenae]
MQQMSGKHADPQNAVQALPPTFPSSTAADPHPLPQLPLTSKPAPSLAPTLYNSRSCLYLSFLCLLPSPSLRFPSKTELPAPAALFRSQRIPAAMAKPCPLPQPQPTLALYQSLWHLPSTSATAAS